MSELDQMQFTPIRGDSQALKPEEVERYRVGLPGWEAVVEQGEMRLRKKFKFKDFAQALAFTNRVGALAEQQDHHPSLLTEWGAVTVWWWTHKVHGLHINDLIMAAKTEQLYGG